MNEPTPIMPPEIAMDISLVGKGALVTSQEVSDTHYKLSATPPIVIDWSTPFRVAATLIQKNQNGSSSCTAQATNYYCQALNQIEHGVSEIYSSRWIYSQTSLGYGQGTYIWKAMGIPINQGAADLNSVPEKDESESWMLDTSDNNHAILEAKTDKFAVISNAGKSIDYFAQIIKDYHGFVTGFNGWDGMFAPDGTVIDWSKSDWGHAVYVCGYEVHNGKKCLVFKNSWSSQWGDGGYGYFPEEFIKSGMMFDAYVYADILDLDPNSMILTKEDVTFLQELEGYNDPAGITYWTGKTLNQYKSARVPDKIKGLQSTLTTGIPVGEVPAVITPVNTSVFSVSDIAGALMGAGLTQLTTKLDIGLILIGSGVALKIILAVLQKYQIPVSK